MKVLLLSLAISALTFSSSLFAGNGWSSSGGGEYIITQNNPWFMGTASVEWCIDHGGDDKFSLPINLAKIEIEKAINLFSTQLKSIHQHETNLYETPANPNFKKRKCGVSKDDNGRWEEDCLEGIQISDTFHYTSDCSKADIEFILGNYKNSQIKTLIKDLGKEKFKKIAGIAIRTKYSQETLRSKGFIYIAADRGDIQYSGERNINIKSDTIWNNVEKIPKTAPFPPNILSSYGRNLPDGLKLKDHTLGPLLPVAAHEFGHTLGLIHNHSKNIMDEDYPANILRTGFTFKGNFTRDSMVLSRSIIEENKDLQIGFEWGLGRWDYELRDFLTEKYPTVFNFSKSDEEKVMHNLFFVFNFKYGSTPDQDEHSLLLVTLENDKFQYKYKPLKNFKLQEVTPCLPTNISAITFRYQTLVDDIINWTFDNSQNKWVENKTQSYLKTQTVNLLTLDNTCYAGKIMLNESDDNHYLDFELTHNYFQGANQLTIRGEGLDEGVTLFFNSSHILESPKENLPEVQPVFLFESDYSGYRN